MINSVYIITASFYDFSNNRVTIGGAQKYILDLCHFFNEEFSIKPVVVVFRGSTSEDVSIEFPFFSILGVGKHRSFFKSSNQLVFDSIYKKYNNHQSIFIIISEQMGIKSHLSNVICIQHGVAFDIPGFMIKGFWGSSFLMRHINKFFRCITNVSRFYNVRNLVCVDYNYYNWFKTLGTIPQGYFLRIVPNYSSSCISAEEFDNKISSISKTIKIVCARRYVDYRGVKLFSIVVQKLLKERKFKIDITFAGDGPLEDSIKNDLKHFDCVHFVKYSPNESVSFHKNFDIAVLPSLYSEGTSLSLCESMAAGCFPIATFVGGMTNMIIDGYNGKLCYPSEESLYNAICDVLTLHRDKYTLIVRNAYQTAKQAFSYDRWKNDWMKIVDYLISRS